MKTFQCGVPSFAIIGPSMIGLGASQRTTPHHTFKQVQQDGELARVFQNQLTINGIALNAPLFPLVEGWTPQTQCLSPKIANTTVY
jgi:hypothetical protein